MGGCGERQSVPEEDKRREKERLEAERLMLQYYKQCANDSKSPDAAMTPGMPKTNKSLRSSTQPRSGKRLAGTVTNDGLTHQGPDEADEFIALMFKSKKLIEPYGVHSSDILDRNYKPLPPRLAGALHSQKMAKLGELRMSRTQESYVVEENKRPDSPTIDSLGAHFRSAKIQSSMTLCDNIPKIPILTQMISPKSMLAEKKSNNAKNYVGNKVELKNKEISEKKGEVFNKGNDISKGSRLRSNNANKNDFKNDGAFIKQFELSAPKGNTANIVNSEYDLENEVIYMNDGIIGSDLLQKDSGIGIPNLKTNTNISITSSKPPYNQKMHLNLSESKSNPSADPHQYTKPKKYHAAGVHNPLEFNKNPLVNMISPSESSNYKVSDNYYRDAEFSSSDLEVMNQRPPSTQSQNMLFTNPKTGVMETDIRFISPEPSDDAFLRSMRGNKDGEVQRGSITPTPNYSHTPERKVEAYRNNANHSTTKYIKGDSRLAGRVMDGNRVRESYNVDKSDISMRSSVASIPDIRGSIGSPNKVRRLHYLRNPPGNN